MKTEGEEPTDQETTGLENAVRRVWELNQRLCAKRGLDLADVLNNFAAAQQEYFRDHQAEADFIRLCDDGCEPRIISALGALLERAPGVWAAQRFEFGTPRDREKALRTLDKSIELAHSHWIRVGGPEYDLDQTGTSVLDLGQLFESLLVYAETFRVSLELREKIGDLTLIDIVKYIIVAYVIETTGRQHDAEVSSIVGVKLDKPDYDESSHRAWRARNFARLEKFFRKVAHIPSTLGTILSESK